MMLAAGQNGKKVEFGLFAFTTTAATYVISTQVSRVEGVFVFPAGAVATDESLYSTNTVSSDGTYLPGTSGITITRTGASKTSGLKCFYLIIGT